MVVGKSGEEIWVDQYGRVKVQFFWDRAGNMDENSSCWIRVAQVWAGKGWGAIFMPRIGQEVIVDFLEGDPDRPIITGRVYNADQTVPYTLPDEQTKSTIKSMSSKGGGGFNEIRLEDKAGSEQIFILGQKDKDIRIKNDVREWIGEDRNLYRHPRPEGPDRPGRSCRHRARPYREDRPRPPPDDLGQGSHQHHRLAFAAGDRRCDRGVLGQPEHAGHAEPLDQRHAGGDRGA